MMKRRNAVLGVILASVLIAAVVIQATFGVGAGGGVRVVPTEMPITQNSTKTFTIILQSPQSDSFDVTIIPGTCGISWFAWPLLEQQRVRVEPRVQTQLYLDVRPTDSGEFYFKVRAKSSSGDYFESDYIWLFSEPPPSPTPGPTPTPTPGPTNKPPKCLGLEPNLPSPQKLLIESETKYITWTACACDPDEDTLQYKFCVHIEGLLGDNCSAWSTDRNWTWPATSSNLGLNNIYVHVRDGKHNTGGPYGDCSFNRSYKIIAGDPPFCACLMPNKFSPQFSGTAITWTACVADNESAQDTFWYRYLVDGLEGRGWSKDNSWTWTPMSSGIYDITVMVRDNFYGSPLVKYPDTCDLERTFENYKID